jgi:hypothetical protein
LKKPPPIETWKPIPWEPADVAALQALERGDATPDQQRRALWYIVNDICGAYDWPYRPGGQDAERDTNVALGRMFVGVQIRTKLKINLAAIRQAKTKTPQEQA